jgi:uncharacterized protein with gpF-like domain
MAEIPENILIESQKFPPKEAVEFFEKKGLKVTDTAKQTAKAVQARLFAVTKSMTMEVLQDMRDEVSKSISQGQTYATFKKNIENKLAAKGWTGERTVTLKSGKVKKVVTTPWRLKTIYRTNLQSSLNAGRFKRQIENAEDRPYLQLIEILDTKTRTTHRAQSGSIQLITSKFWKSPNSWYPPNGFNCRGRTRALTKAQAKSRGIGIKSPGTKPDPGFGNNPATSFFKPKKSDFDSDIWKAGENMNPSELS